MRRSFAGSYSPLYQAAYMIGGLQLRALGKQVFLISGETDVALKTRAAAAALPLLTKPVSGAQMRALLVRA